MTSSSTTPTTTPSHPQPTTSQPHITLPRMPAKQRMALSLKSLAGSLFGGGSKDTTAPPAQLFAKTDPAIDGDDCLHDCDSCSVKYPRNFKIDTEDVLYGQIKAWSTHAVVGTGKADWVRDVADEEGSVMEAIGKADAPKNGKLMLSASNMPTPHDTNDYSEPTTLLLLPAFKLIHNIHPSNVPQFLTEIVNNAPTNTSPLTPTTASSSIPASLPSPGPDIPALTINDCPHQAVVLMCSQKTRDARCGQSAPLLRKELQRHLTPLGLYRDLHDERPGGVGIYFISHVGGHKYSANVMVYRRPNAFGQDDPVEGEKETNGTHGTNGHSKTNGANGVAKKDGDKNLDQGAAQCIWLARIMPEDIENLVRYTILKGKVVKPETQLRGGFDRAKGLMSW